MADNIPLLDKDGNPVTVRYDEVSGVYVLVNKLDAGGDGVSVPIIAGSQAASASLPVTDSTEDVARVGIVTESAPGTDTASSGLNGRLQRIAQRITSLIALLPTALGANGGLKVEGVSSGTVVPVSVPASENQIGTVGSPDNAVTITCSLDTSAYADGDVLFDTQEVALAARVNGGTTILQNVVITDISDQGQALDLIFFNANTSLGTENSAPDIDDTEVLTVIGRISVSSSDYYDLGANRVACVRNLGLLMEAGGGTTSLYVAGVSRGTGTYSASGIQIQFGFMRN